MTRLTSRLRRLERRQPDPFRPRLFSSPTDGMTAEDIDRGLAEWEARGPLTAVEFIAKHRVHVHVGRNQSG